MNRKQLALLVFLLVVLGLAGLMIYHRQNDLSQAGNRDLGKKLLGDFPFNDVAHLELKQGTNELNLVKKDNLWRVKERSEYPANYSEISDFLLKAKDLKVVSSDKAGPSEMSRLELTPGKGTNAALVVEFKDPAEKPLRVLLLGKKHIQKSNRPSPFGDAGDTGFPDGRYVRVGTNSDSVELISEAFSNIEPKPEQWLNKDFFKVEKVRSIEVKFPVATNSWRLSRDTETAEWKLGDAKASEQLDTAKTSGLATALASPSFNDVETSAKPEKLGLDKPTLVTLETFDNFTYTLKVGTKTNDNYPLAIAVVSHQPETRTAGKDEKPEEKARLDKEFKDSQKKLEEKLTQEKPLEKWTYLVSSWTLDPLLKERSQLLVEKKADTGKEDKTGGATASIEPPKLADPAPQPLGTNLSK